ncbi:MAG TPA: S-methyl-5'-thioadenosine phosphorylase [Armatimonadetes bacterium]|jgi:5'-methylthioadenosine phosphorylase|nr:S-methyl-5'-thioadenosine phosphorylase [Armatimonadota bacterium]
MSERAEIGVFGGSGFYAFLDKVEEVKVETPYGAPSDRIALAEVHGRRVAFLPRHGREHSLPPHKIPYQANLWAMRSLGVKRIIAPTAAGSLQPDVHPGDFVVCDQFVDRTYGRADTFYDGPVVTHISTAAPYCPQLRALAAQVGERQGVRIHRAGTVVVIQGPRFSTAAESRWFSQMGWHVVNMTQYPECVLARELEICYTNISLITDYDAGLVGLPGIEPVSVEKMLEVFHQNNARVKELILGMIEVMPESRDCDCGCALRTARIE